MSNQLRNGDICPKCKFGILRYVPENDWLTCLNLECDYKIALENQIQQYRGGGIPEVIETFQKLLTLHIKKNEDYTGKDSNRFFNFNVADTISNLFESNRDKVFSTMIGIKLGRIAALLNSGKAANNESVLDSFDDLIIYAAIWKADCQRIGKGLFPATEQRESAYRQPQKLSEDKEL